MKKYLFFHWNPVLICVIASLVSAQTPVVTNTIPPNGAKNVDPLLTEIKIVFSAPVKMNSWSFVATGKGSFLRILTNHIFRIIKPGSPGIFRSRQNLQYWNKQRYEKRI